MGKHLINGQFKSDKYPDCPTGLIPFKAKDLMFQDLGYEYARRRREVDPEFSEDLIEALRLAGYDVQGAWTTRGAEADPPAGMHFVKTELSHDAVQLLERLVETGLFGSDPSSAATRLVEMGLKEHFSVEEPRGS